MLGHLIAILSLLTHTLFLHLHIRSISFFLLFIFNSSRCTYLYVVWKKNSILYVKFQREKGETKKTQQRIIGFGFMNPDCCRVVAATGWCKELRLYCGGDGIYAREIGGIIDGFVGVLLVSGLGAVTREKLMFACGAAVTREASRSLDGDGSCTEVWLDASVGHTYYSYGLQRGIGSNEMFKSIALALIRCLVFFSVYILV